MYYVITSVVVSLASSLQYLTSKSELAAWNMLILFAEMLILLILAFSQNAEIFFGSLCLISVAKIAFFIGYGLYFDALFGTATTLAITAAIRLVLLCLDWPEFCTQEEDQTLAKY